jgi:hypothetical protein
MGRKHFSHARHGASIDLDTMRLRFLSYVEMVDGVDGCWLWTGGEIGDNYGKFLLWGRPEQAHRASWLLFVGSIPRGMLVLHHCDIRRCTNWRHLWIGDQADNMADMHRRGRDRWHNDGKSPKPWTASDYLHFMTKDIFSGGELL